jgi:hypothetical protein
MELARRVDDAESPLMAVKARAEELDAELSWSAGHPKVSLLVELDVFVIALARKKEKTDRKGRTRIGRGAE